jgi:hypothetical protein
MESDMEETIEETLERWAKLEHFSEVYEVVSTVHVVMDNKFYKIEIVKRYDTHNPPYGARWYVLEDVALHPLEMPSEKYRPDKAQAWVDNYITWIHTDTPEAALSQALHFLTERKSKD